MGASARRLTSTVLAMACAAAVSACAIGTPTSAAETDEVAPSPDVPSTAERRPQPTPSANEPTAGPFDATVPPVRPAALAAPFSQEAAVEVGEYFFELMPYMWATGDTAQFEALGTRECSYCANMLEVSQDVFDLGQLEVGNQITIDNSSADLLDQEFLDYYGYRAPTAGVTVNYVQGPWKRIDATGKVVKRDERYVYYNAHLYLTKVNGAWRVRGASVDQVLESEDPITGIRPDESN